MTHEPSLSEALIVALGFIELLIDEDPEVEERFADFAKEQRDQPTLNGLRPNA